MSQRLARQRRVALGCIAAFCFTLAACSVAELKSAVTTEESKQAPRPVPAVRYTRPGDPDILEVTDPLIGGTQPMSGIASEFARIIVGSGNTISFIKPVAVGGVRDQLYVVDAGDKTVYRYDITKKTISALGQSGAQLLGDPMGLYVKSDLSFYICDPTGKQVLYFDGEGHFVRRFTDIANLSRPVDVAVDEERGQVYVADGSYSHIIVFSEYGQALYALGGRGKGPGKFRAITSIAKEKTSLYVTDRIELPLQELELSNGAFRFSMGQGELIWPTSVVIDPKRRIYVSDRNDNSIKIFDDIHLVAVVGGRGSAPGRFKEITDMWLSDAGLLYVADSGNRRVQVFKVITDTDSAPAPIPQPSE